MENIVVHSDNRPSNFVIFGLVFEDRQIFKETVKCVLGDELNDKTYAVSEKEDKMGSPIYNRIRFDVYAEDDKIYGLDMQNGYVGEMIRNRLVYYSCRAIGGQDVKNFEYDKLKNSVVTFIFEKHSYKSKRFMTNAYMAYDNDGKMEKYSDLINVVEVNLGRYKKTDKVELNILCEFLRIQNNGHLEQFHKNHGSSEFGKMLYDKYMKVAFDKERIERVGNMQLYQAKTQVKYLSENDIKFLWEEWNEERSGEIIKEMLIYGDSIEKISKITHMPEEKIREIKKILKNSVKSNDIIEFIENKIKANGTQVIVSGEIHTEMELNNRMPTVCSAMRKLTNKYKHEYVDDHTPSGQTSTLAIKYFYE